MCVTGGEEGRKEEKERLTEKRRRWEGEGGDEECQEKDEELKTEGETEHIWKEMRD